MQVQVISIHAALAGAPSIVWEGQVPGPFDGGVEAVNEYLFRFFNRVDDNDAARLAKMRYGLPSLSTGDLLHWESNTYRVAGVGFEKITGSEEYVTALAVYALKSS